MQNQDKNYNFQIIFVVATGLMLFVFFMAAKSGNLAILHPKGVIAASERRLIVTSVLLMLIIVIPVFVATYIIANKYRADSNKAQYAPNWQHTVKNELLLWAAPAVIVAILGTLTWDATHKLDPYKQIASANKPITIQVVAMRWKWLFIYPEQNIATLNFVEFPQNTPVDFELTADAPMNSFWIPQLGGQMYAMPGMGTSLHLLANTTGEFAGSAAEMSGGGFAGMKFVAKSASQSDFDTWIKSVKASSKNLSTTEYGKLALPSKNNPVVVYSSAQKNLYDNIIMKYMMPSSTIGALQ